MEKETSEVNNSNVASAPEGDGIGGSCSRASAPAGDQLSQAKRPVPSRKGKIVVTGRRRDGEPLAARLRKLADDQSRSSEKSRHTSRVVTVMEEAIWGAT